MAKLDIYKQFITSGVITIKEFITHGEKPYIINLNKCLNNPDLFDNIAIQIEHIIKSKTVEFNSICACSMQSLPFATNVATSFGKKINYVRSFDDCNRNERGNIKNIKIENGVDIEDKILLIESICENNFYLENIITKIHKYGGHVMGVIIVINLCEGEYCNLLQCKEPPVFQVFNLFDIFTYYENNNLIDMFYSEKVKYYCEKLNKLNMEALLQKK